MNVYDICICVCMRGVIKVFLFDEYMYVFTWYKCAPLLDCRASVCMLTIAVTASPGLHFYFPPSIHPSLICSLSPFLHTYVPTSTDTSAESAVVPYPGHGGSYGEGVSASYEGSASFDGSASYEGDGSWGYQDQANGSTY